MDTFDRDRYAKKINSKELLRLALKCPECGTLIKATGNMYLQRKYPVWWIEYWCPVDEEYLMITTPESDKLAAQVAKNYGD